MIPAKTSTISDRILKLSESATLKMSKLARELRAKGHDVISLSLGEPDFDTPAYIKQAAKQALDDGFTKYTPVPGLPVIREAISKKFKSENGLNYEPSQIVVSNGAKQSVYNLSMALLNEGDEAIILAPYWVSYYEIIKLGGGTPVVVSAGIEQDFKVNAEQLKAAITPRTKFVLFSSPCNPTGSVYQQAELEALANVIAKHEQITVIADEIYEYINFSSKHISIGSIDSVKDRTVTINGFSKGFAMTGWRLGYIGAPQTIANACIKIQGQVTSGATAFGQVAGAFALNGDRVATAKMRDAYLQRRNLVKGLLDEIPGVKTNNPEGAFYIFPDISAYFGKSDGNMTINNSDDFCEYLLNNAYVAVVSGSAFGADNCFRISYAASEDQLKEAIKRMGEALAKLS